MKLIDKDAIVAEIEKLKYVIMPYPTMAEKVAYRDGIEDTIKIVIKSLEVKEVDLEKEIDKYFNGWGEDTINGGQYGINLDIRECKDIAKHFFELGMQQSKNYSSNEA